MMESGDTEIPTAKAAIRSIFSSRPVKAPYVITPEEISAEQDSPIGITRHTGNLTVVKGFWNARVVGIKVLSNDTKMDVSGSSSKLRI
jgi:hypothetical protein